MPEPVLGRETRDSETWKRLWSFTLDPYRTRRRPTREVRVGEIGIGGRNPIRIQSMAISDTLDTRAMVAEIAALHAAGSEIVRVTAPNRTSAENLGAIRRELRRRGVRVPLVADIHFTPQAALIAALHVEKVRINPGNYSDRKRFERREYTDAEYEAELAGVEVAFRPLVLRCKERGVAMRIGANHGSLSDRILNRYGDTPLGMVESALEFVRICEQHGYRDLVLSMKASDVKVMIQAYRLLAARMRELGMDYPFHLGVTEAGAGLAARVKSAIGIAALLADGIGDTIRVSLTEDSVHELPVARALASLHPGTAEGGATAAPEPLPRWDPYRFERRQCAPLGGGAARLASSQPPRIEIVATLPASGCEPRAAVDAASAAARVESAPGGSDLLLLALPPDAGTEWAAAVRALAVWVGSREAGARPALGLEVPAAFVERADLGDALGAWARVSLRLGPDDLARPQVLGAALPPGLQYVLELPAGDLAAIDRAARRLAERLRQGAWPLGAVALACDGPGGAAAAHPCRRLLAAWPDGFLPPVVLRGPRSPSPARVDAHIGLGELQTAAGLGALLADGIGDAVQLYAEPDADSARRLAAEILQAARLRLTKADFIACPSCGRTQFDLQTTTARIEAGFRHLRGLKIAVMGCIVNGPGEMADADFGYVGSGPGRIDLYVGKERVERSVPQEEAVERLAALIRDRGLWVEPDPAG